MVKRRQQPAERRELKYTDLNKAHELPLGSEPLRKLYVIINATVVKDAFPFISQYHQVWNEYLTKESEWKRSATIYILLPNKFELQRTFTQECISIWSEKVLHKEDIASTVVSIPNKYNLP